MDLTVFSVNGETYMGKIITTNGQVDSKALSNISENARETSSVSNDKYILVYAPAKVVFEIEKTSATSAEMRWKILPLVARNLLKGDSVARNVFYFPKEQVAFSGIDATTDLNEKLVAAYKELV